MYEGKGTVVVGQVFGNIIFFALEQSMVVWMKSEMSVSQNTMSGCFRMFSLVKCAPGNGARIQVGHQKEPG